MKYRIIRRTSTLSLYAIIQTRFLQNHLFIKEINFFRFQPYHKKFRFVPNFEISRSPLMRNPVSIRQASYVIQFLQCYLAIIRLTLSRSRMAIHLLIHYESIWTSFLCVCSIFDKITHHLMFA